MCTKEDTRQLQHERAELINRLSQAYRMIGPAALYVRWYGEEGEHREAARKLAKEMQAFTDEGLFGDILKGEATR